jgi:hypothetical protein
VVNILNPVPQTVVSDLHSVVMKIGVYTLQLFYQPYIGKINLNKIQSDMIFVQFHVYYYFPFVCILLLHIHK